MPAAWKEVEINSSQLPVDIQLDSSIKKYLQSLTLVKGGRYKFCWMYDFIDDAIIIPRLRLTKSFTKEFFCNNLFHELIHSTGHYSRLNRHLSRTLSGKAEYEEELVAEIGAMMIGLKYACLEETLLDNLLYLHHFSVKRKGRNSTFVKCYDKAVEAVKYIRSYDT